MQKLPTDSGQREDTGSDLNDEAAAELDLSGDSQCQVSGSNTKVQARLERDRRAIEADQLTIETLNAYSFGAMVGRLAAVCLMRPRGLGARRLYDDNLRLCEKGDQGLYDWFRTVRREPDASGNRLRIIATDYVYKAGGSISRTDISIVLPPSAVEIANSCIGWSLHPDDYFYLSIGIDRPTNAVMIKDFPVLNRVLVRGFAHIEVRFTSPGPMDVTSRDMPLYGVNAYVDPVTAKVCLISKTDRLNGPRYSYIQQGHISTCL